VPGGGAPGRPSHRLAIDPAGPVVLAAQVHAEGWQVALVGLGSRVVAIGQGPGPMGGPVRVLRAVAEAGAGLLRASGRTCVGAGLAIASSVSEPDGTAVNPFYLGWPAGTPVRELFAEQVRLAGITAPDTRTQAAASPRSKGARGPQAPSQGGSGATSPLALPAPLLAHAAAPPCFAANDINLAALVEYRHGAGRDARHLLVVATGHRGVGSALVLNGELYAGSSGLGMEAGHVTVRPEGRPCRCGSRGCLDVETDPVAFLEAAGRDPDPAAPILDQAIALLHDEYVTDPAVPAAADALIDRLGLGLAGLVNVLNPDRVLLGGLHRYLLEVSPERLAATVTSHSLARRGGPAPLVPCALDSGPLLGAAELAWQPVLDDPYSLEAGS
jgi:predicted NBD/HSP70 family sugar kinase